MALQTHAKVTAASFIPLFLGTAGTAGTMELLLWCVSNTGVSRWLPESWPQWLRGEWPGFFFALFLFSSRLFRSKLRILLGRHVILNVRNSKRIVAFAAMLLAMSLVFSAHRSFVHRAEWKGWGLEPPKSQPGEFKYVLLELWLAGFLLVVYTSLPRPLSFSEARTPQNS